MARTHPHAEAIYRVVSLSDGSFGVEVSTPDTYPATVSKFATEADAEAWIAEHKSRTAPLLAGAGVFGLAISFGSQSLMRDIISGLFYMWDDAFRISEYIDTGRLRGSVEAIGVRSIKLRHHNGPLHTIPYGQLGAVTNLSRDFATLKFNLRLELGTDIELVRKTAKQIGLAMQDENSEIAAEVILPLKMQGIAEIAENALVVRFKFTARPVKPSWIQREYLKRMYQVFAEKGISFAVGGLTLRTMLPPSPGDLGNAADVASLPLPEPGRVA